MFHKRVLVILFLISAVLVNGNRCAVAQRPPSSREYELKAAWIYHFSNSLVKWPDTAVGINNEFVIGILGKDPFGPSRKWSKKLEKLKTGDGTQIVVRRFNSIKDFKERNTTCHILFIAPESTGGLPEKPEDRLKAALEKTKESNVLIVSDDRGFSEIQTGVMIHLVVDARANRVRMKINRAAAQRVNLSFTDRLRGSPAVLEDVGDSAN